MTLPFTIEQFLQVFADYNTAVWPTQILLQVLAFICLVLLFRPQPWTSRVVSLVLAFFWLWMAIAYHFLFFSRINPAALLFGSVFLLESVLLARAGLMRRKIVFRPLGGVGGWVGRGLITFALVLYPVFGLALGQRFPAFPTFGLPCPTTLFSIGILMFVERAQARVLLIVPVLWTFIGSLAAISLGITQDLSLLVAGAVGLSVILGKQTGPESG